MTPNCNPPAVNPESPIMDRRLFTRKEAMDKLRLKPAHFSKVANGKVKGLPKLACVRIGRRQLFREDTIDRWIIAVEEQSCNGVR
jgi:hypothetical protein